MQSNYYSYVYSVRLRDMNDLQNIREEWSLAERVAFYIRDRHPELFDEALDAIVREDIEKAKICN